MTASLPNAGDPATDSGQFLSFRLGNDIYGVDILRVQEIRGWENVRVVPDAPDYVKGVLDLRGIIVPIIDLRVRFGDAEPAYESTTVVIVIAVGRPGGQHQLVGAVVDGVSDVLDAQGADIKPAPNLGACVSRRYLRGMVSLPGGMVILLDVDKLFSDIEFDQVSDIG